MFKNKEEQFDFYWKEIFTGLSYNPIEFNTYRFDQTMSLPGKVNKLYDMFKVLAMNNQEVMDYLKVFVETFDEKLYKTLTDVLNVWLDDGKLAEIMLQINELYHQHIVDYEDYKKIINEALLELESNIGDLDSFREFDNSIINKMSEEFKERGVNVKWFGAKGDNINDDTIAIQNAVDFASRFNLKTYIPEGIYLIKAHVDNQPSFPKYLENRGGIHLPSNTHLQLSNKTVLQEIENIKTASNILRTYNSKNVIIEGGTLRGIQGVSVGNEWHYGIAIQSGSDVEIRNVICEKFLGDGINIQRGSMNDMANFIPENITIKNVVCDKNGRQGLSIEEVDGCRVVNSFFSNTKGTLPASGIDIEPAYQNIEKDKPKCENIFIDQCEFLNNDGNGLQIIGSHIVKNVSIKNCKFSGNRPNRETTKWSVRLGSCNQVSFSNNELINEVISFAGLNNSEINNNRIVNGQITSEISDNTSVLIEGNYFNHTKNFKGLHSMYFASGSGLMKDLIVKGNTFRNLVDIARETASDYGLISAIFILGVGDMIITDNIFIGYDFHIADYTVSQYNKTERLMISGNTFMSSRAQAINTKATFVSILNNSFVGCCFMLGYNNDYSRDTQYTPEKTGGHISFIGNSGVKKPIHDVPYKKLNNFDEVMIHLTKKENNTYSTTVENNNADYIITSPYFFVDETYGYADTIGSSIKVLNSMPVDFNKFKIGDVLYILPSNELGFILENKTFKKII